MQIESQSNTAGINAPRFLQTKIVARVISMSSREIADLTGKRHDHVIRDIRATLDALKDDPDLGDQFTESFDKRGYTTKYTLDRELTQTLITGYSVSLRRLVVRRLNELEESVADQAKASASRQIARLEAPFMSEAIKYQRLAHDKDLAPHVFSNEFNLINRLVLGRTSSQYRAEHGMAKDQPIRDALTPCQIKAVEHMQRLNTSLIDLGMPYEQRKAKLHQVFLLRHQRALIAETVRIES
ncbi:MULTISPECIES: Rha family transcriptional regulator [Pseudomonas syringae group]|uniref:Rha family transcriptional regulator n=1 Tax=Pseudomonas syringae group TaxID=136849 RepID=UPI00067C801A|nr:MULTISPECIES: Rha family transcriptional regulator [Pseudomonas syringae group]